METVATRANPGSPSSKVRTDYRSAVTNGTRLHVEQVGHTAWSRRFRDVLEQIIADIGGPDGLSEGQRQLARRAATLSLECEKLESRGLLGESIDVDLYGQMTDRLGRAFGRLGLKRQSRDITPRPLAQYLDELANAEPEDETDE